MYRPEKLEELQREFAAWEERHQNQFANEMEPEFFTEDGMPIKRIYTPLDLAEFDYIRDLGFPGEYPYVRGNTSTMYRSQFWSIAQYAGFASAEETNALFRRMLMHGNLPSMACDLPTQLGLDPDDPLARGEVGMAGVTIKSLKDWETIYDEINLGETFAYTVANANAAAILGMHIALAEKQGADLKKLRGGLQNDILKEFAARGNFIFPVGPSMRLVADVIVYCAEHLPEFWSISVCGGHYSEAGCNRIQEAAFALGDAIAYMDAVVDRGVNIDAFAKNIFFLMKNNHYDFFEEVAKFRAMRRMWARILKERYRAEDPRSMQFRALVHSGGSQLTKERPELNIVRTAMACLSGVLGGAQQIGLRTIDEVYGIPVEKSEFIAIGTQQVIQYETGIHATVDPLAGSYYVESLTNEFEKKVWAELDAIEKMGGMPKAIEKGYVSAKIEEEAFLVQRATETGKRARVGVNKFIMEEEEQEREFYRPRPEEEKRQIEDLNRLRQTRDNQEVQNALSEIRRVAELPEANENNLVPPIIRAVKAYATTGEIHGVLRDVFGRHRERR